MPCPLSHSLDNDNGCRGQTAERGVRYQPETSVCACVCVWTHSSTITSPDHQTGFVITGHSPHREDETLSPRNQPRGHGPSSTLSSCLPFPHSYYSNNVFHTDTSSLDRHDTITYSSVRGIHPISWCVIKQTCSPNSPAAHSLTPSGWYDICRPHYSHHTLTHTCIPVRR